jgi:hypothetical protein
MEREDRERDSITSPSEDQHEATTPPGGNEPDEEATEEAREKLDQAGGGH